MTRKILDSTLENATFNIVFQIFLRCITFFLTAFSLRYITSDVVGVMNVRLLLLESTILFLSREAFRRAALSQSESHSWPQIINLVWLTIPLSVVISLFFSFLWLNILDVPSNDITPYYSIGVWSISVSCVIEMFAEPLFIISQAFLFNKLKVALDSLVLFVRTIIFASWIVVNSSQAVIAFSVAQILANLLYIFTFYSCMHLYIKRNNENKSKNIFNNITELKNTNEANKKQQIWDSQIKEGQLQDSSTIKRRKSSLVGFDEPFPFTSLADFLPKSVEGQDWIQPNSAKLTWSFFKQGVLKQILTEGERYIMTLFSVMSFEEQGMYDVVNNLGSLVVRFLFRPVEDSLYFYFTQTVKRNSNIKDQNQERMKEASAVLSGAMKCLVGIGLLIFTFGQSYSTLLLYLYGGQTAVSGQGPALLRTHSFSVLLLGINGITECYAFSTMTAEQLNRYNYLMAIFSVLFLIISWGLTKFIGGIGFIFANCSIMSARIAHSIVFIKSRYNNTSFQPTLSLIPNKYFLITLFISLVLTKVTENYCDTLSHFFIGAACFSVVVIVWSFHERELIVLALEKLKSKKQ